MRCASRKAKSSGTERRYIDGVAWFKGAMVPHFDESLADDETII
jgi:hypothetical protein